MNIQHPAPAQKTVQRIDLIPAVPSGNDEKLKLNGHGGFIKIANAPLPAGFTDLEAKQAGNPGCRCRDNRRDTPARRGSDSPTALARR